MKYKKIKLSILVSLCALLIVVFSFHCFSSANHSSNHNEIVSNTKDEIVCAKTDEYTSADELYKNSDLIIYGTKLSENPPTVINDENGEPLAGYTLSNIRIDKIINNSRYSSINDTITILENEYYNSTDNITYHVNGYNKMKTNNTYILFLKYSLDDHWYYPTGVVYGKIPLNKNELIMIPNDLTLEHNVQQIASCIREKYNADK